MGPPRSPGSHGLSVLCAFWSKAWRTFPRCNPRSQPGGFCPSLKRSDTGTALRGDGWLRPLPGHYFLPIAARLIKAAVMIPACVLSLRQEARTQRGPFFYHCAELYKRLKAQEKGGKHLGQTTPVVMLLVQAELAELNIPHWLPTYPKSCRRCHARTLVGWAAGSHLPPPACAHGGTGCQTLR